MPKPTHARLANTPVPPDGNENASDSGRPESAAPSSPDCANATVLDAEYVDIDPLRKFRRIGAGLEDRNALQVVRVCLQLPLQHFADGMVMMGVVADHGLQILQARGLGRVRLERGRGDVWILRGVHRGIEQRLRNGARDLRLFANEAAAQSEDAAGLVLVFPVQIGSDLLVAAILRPDMGDRIRGQERMDLTLLDRELQEIAGIGAPVHIPVGIDALLGELDRKEILVWSTEIADRDDLALEVGQSVDT